MKPVISPTTPASWLTRQLAGSEPAVGEPAALAPEPRRRHSRHSIRHLQVESPVYGWVVDASEGGLRMESVSQLPAGGEYTFRLRHRAQFLSLRGRVVWSHLDRTEETRAGRLNVYHTGIELCSTGSLPAWLSILRQLTRAAIGA